LDSANSSANGPWGGVTGIRESLPLVDGGQFFKPEFAIYSKDGKQWIVEGHGVDPDIVVDNDPGKEFKGEDQQLDRAIQEMQDELKTKRFDIPSPPPWPNRNPGGRTARDSTLVATPHPRRNATG
jgi:tricorn protease